MNEQDRTAYWIEAERMRLKVELKYVPKIYKALKAHISSFITAYKVDPSGAVGSINMELWNDDLLKVYNAMFRESFMITAKATYKSLKRIKLIPGMGVNEEWTQIVNDWLARNGLQMVTRMSGRTREIILAIVNETLQEGVQNGWGAEVVARTVVKRLQDEEYTFSLNRARMIARTETGRAANEGHMAGARSSRIVLDKVWISAKDNRTRRMPRDEFDHLNLDGQTVGMDEQFVGRSEMGELRVNQPGDVSAPAGFTINCRCRVAFQPRRDANGRVIRRSI
jgi:hypothetical protein